MIFLIFWCNNISVVSTRTIPTPKGMKTADFCGSPWIQLALAIFSLGTAHQPGDFRGSAGRNGWMLSEENGHESILGGSWTAGIWSGWICWETRLQVWSCLVWCGLVWFSDWLKSQSEERTPLGWRSFLYRHVTRNFSKEITKSQWWLEIWTPDEATDVGVTHSKLIGSLV